PGDAAGEGQAPPARRPALTSAGVDRPTFARLPSAGLPSGNGRATFQSRLYHSTPVFDLPENRFAPATRAVRSSAESGTASVATRTASSTCSTVSQPTIAHETS